MRSLIKRPGEGWTVTEIQNELEPLQKAVGGHLEVERHSRKPAEVRERIVRLLGDVPRIELFARERVPGWDAWGNEV